MGPKPLHSLQIDAEVGLHAHPVAQESAQVGMLAHDVENVRSSVGARAWFSQQMALQVVQLP
ncbi:MAG: hypothetical protein IJB81_03800 [Clostridia bacterium]|nr:hypothetical protein [Clostridia bacterium]